MAKLAKALRSRELRRAQTEAEKVLWRYLRNRHLTGRKFRRQYVFKGFILDFYCAEEKIAIELDGPIHLKQQAYDAPRQEFIEDNGIKVIRFKNEMVFKDINKVLGIIKSSFPSPSQMEKAVGFAPADEASFPSPSQMEKAVGFAPADEVSGCL
jgi:very-short-patch-repair endonuclease